MAEHFSSTAFIPERAWLVAVRQGDAPAGEVEEMLRELRALAVTVKAEVAGETIFRVRSIHSGLFIGKGQAEELALALAAANVDVVVFDDELSPSQARNLADALHVRVIDRTQLILDIFAARARTLEGRLQIELAQLQYMRPRLRGLWTHLERQRGGAIGLRGPGEKQLELDRRRIGQRMSMIRRQLEEVRQRRGNLHHGRQRHGWALVTLVGYTNAGKSTLLNRLTQAAVPADPRLFATLDPTTRQLELPNRQHCLLTDTVGFIRKHPHPLVEAFQATLEEVSTSDLLLHVVDAANPHAMEQAVAVEQVLEALHALDKPCLVVFNKMDLAEPGFAFRALQERYPNATGISAATGEGIPALLDAIADHLRHRSMSLKLRIPAEEGKILALLHAEAHIQSQRLYGKWWHITARVPHSLAAKLAPFRTEKDAPDE